MTAPSRPTRCAPALLPALFVSLFAGLLASSAALAQDDLLTFPTTKLSAGIHVIQAEVASDGPRREQGLMFRKTMPDNQGMVFVFGYSAVQCMWMKNTLLPLSVAFMDESGKILNIEDMQAQTLNPHCAAKPAAYALEMNLGWFKKHGIAPGQSVQGLPGAP